MNNYIVTTHKNISIEDVTSDLIRTGSSDPAIPSREVTRHSDMLGSNRNSQFFLTKTEAANLRTDSRIEFIQKFPTGGFVGDLVTNSIDNSALINYGDSRLVGRWNKNEGYNTASMKDHPGTYSNSAFRWMTNNTPFPYPSTPEGEAAFTSPVPLSGSVGRALDGNGVDLIIIDNGNYYHQEFLRNPEEGIEEFFDPTNKSRVNFLSWYNYLGIDTPDPQFHNNPAQGGYHGTVLASLAAGNNFGWAPKVELYFINATSETEADNAYPLYDAFTLVKRFHESKSIDPNTGHKRPTVVSTSFTLAHYPYRGYIESTDNLTHIDQFYPTGSSAGLTGNNNTASLELGFTDFSLSPPDENPYDVQHDKWVPSINAVAEECSDLGIIICQAGGNRYMPKAGQSSSIDDPYFYEKYYSPFWESYYTYDEDNSRYDAGDKVHYHRCGPPSGNSSVVVASMNVTNTGGSFIPYFPSFMHVGLGKFSGRGPRVDIAALDTSYTAYKFDNGGGDLDYNPTPHINYLIPSTNFNKNFIYNTRAGGTSFAQPQIAGFACLWKQMYPTGSVNEFKDFLWANANTHSFNPTLNDPTTDQGGLYFKGNANPSQVNINNDGTPSVEGGVLQSNQHRAEGDEIRLANWPFNKFSIKVANLGNNVKFKIR